MAALSINRKKHIRSLSRKKFRNETGLFIVEGDKMVREIMDAGKAVLPFRVETVVATGDWLAESGGSIPGGTERIEAGAAELKQLSQQQEPNRVLAVVQQPEYTPDIQWAREGLSLALENLQDPGNMGTIIRTADWFGIRDIFCSADSVELYNPKVIQSTMGSFLRVRVHYLDLPGLIAELGGGQGSTGGGSAGLQSSGNNGTFQVFATGSRGENLFRCDLPDVGLILLGNESRGLSKNLVGLADRVISIPPQNPSSRPESLNVASAAAILCSEFRRRTTRNKSRALPGRN
jgi:TrmH family RNA methyltransferase